MISCEKSQVDEKGYSISKQYKVELAIGKYWRQPCLF